MFDVSPLVLEARSAVLEVAQVYWKHTHPWLIGLLVHGSALKGGFIPGCSDIDFQLYLEEEAFAPNGELPLTIASAIQRELARIDTTPFQYIQAYTHGRGTIAAKKARGHTPPVAGAYHMIYGELPVAEATTEQVLQGARRTLELIPRFSADAVEDLLSSGGGRLQRSVRLLCTSVWPTLYSMLTLQAEQPYAIWRLPKDAAIALVPEAEPAGQEIRRFYQQVRAYYSQEHTGEGALAVMAQGVAFLHTAEHWYNEYS